jgi:hypothetical protein
VEYVVCVFVSTFTRRCNFGEDVGKLLISKWCWVDEPLNLFLYKRLKTGPLFLGIVNIWELPEAFSHLDVQKRISEIQYIHGDQVEVNEVQEQTL